MAKDAYIHIRTTTELKQAAKQHAAETGRTLAGLIEYLLRQEMKKNKEWADNSGKRSGNIGGNTMLKEKIEKAIEKEAMKKGIMGSEGVSVTLALTDAEKAEFLSQDGFDSKNWWWEFDGNELTITYTEE